MRRASGQAAADLGRQAEAFGLHPLGREEQLRLNLCQRKVTWAGEAQGLEGEGH